MGWGRERGGTRGSGVESRFCGIVARNKSYRDEWKGLCRYEGRKDGRKL